MREMIENGSTYDRRIEVTSKFVKLLIEWLRKSTSRHLLFRRGSQHKLFKVSSYFVCIILTKLKISIKATMHNCKKRFSSSPDYEAAGFIC